jgi:dipeptidyl aminopeptidase/acylaminoacyl peptidase
VTHVFDYLARDFILPRQEKIEWKGVDGVSIEGMLHYPLDYEDTKRYPLVMELHGGMGSSNQFGFGSWSRFFPVLTAKGYAVLAPNYRGSGGYGSDFERDIMGHFFHNSHLDVMAGADRVIELGIADGDRMVVRGWSSGGYLTNKIITFTDRFKAASSGASAVNWISFYSQSDVRYFRTAYFGGTPWQKDAPADFYWEQSPLSDIANVKTPTLVLVGKEDVRVPAPQSVELYRALKSNGVPTRLYIAPREGHGWRELHHQLFKMNVELEWFERYAMGREHVWEKAPSDSVENTESKAPTQPDSH